MQNKHKRPDVAIALLRDKFRDLRILVYMGDKNLADSCNGNQYLMHKNEWITTDGVVNTVYDSDSDTVYAAVYGATYVIIYRWDETTKIITRELNIDRPTVVGAYSAIVAKLKYMEEHLIEYINTHYDCKFRGMEITGATNRENI